MEEGGKFALKKKHRKTKNKKNVIKYLIVKLGIESGYFEQIKQIMGVHNGYVAAHASFAFLQIKTINGE